MTYRPGPLGDPKGLAPYLARELERIAQELARATPVYEAADLPTPSAAPARAFVSNANATTFHSVVAGGGANFVPVFWDGAAWRIG